MEQAIANYTNAIILEPGYAEAYNNRGLAYSLKGEYARGIKDYERYLELVPDAKNREILISLIEGWKSSSAWQKSPRS